MTHEFHYWAFFLAALLSDVILGHHPHYGGGLAGVLKAGS